LTVFIRALGVARRYGDLEALAPTDVELSAGETVALVGPNGAGKSTLLAVISGLLTPRRGTITFKGQDLLGRSPREILQLGISQVPQDHSLFPDMTVRKNVELGGYLIRDRHVVAERLERVMSLFPLVASRAKDRASNLSGGQQRATEFARCLMLDPQLVILDEPSMGLDPKTTDIVFDAMRAMHAEGRTLLLVEQNVRDGLGLASHGVLMENGRVRLSGTGQQVLNHPDIGALYLGGASAGSEK
jgi:ABC-type branched-subunit amino acid transport system ATPase component